jgi:hypothetical protein
LPSGGGDVRKLLSVISMITIMAAGCNGCRSNNQASDPQLVINTHTTTEYPGIYSFLRSDGNRGTCFVVDYKGSQFLITAKHLVKDGTLFILWYGGEEIDITAGRAGLMHAYDIAVMEITGVPHTLKIAPEKLNPPKVYAFGYTTMTEVKRTTGIIVGNKNYLTKAELQAGMSGGPLLNARGEVLGVNSAREVNPYTREYHVSHHADISHAINIMDNLIRSEESRKKLEAEIEKANKALQKDEDSL